MKLYKCVLILLLLLLSNTCFSQHLPLNEVKPSLITFPSPSAWRFSNFGNYPVSNYSGIVNVDVDIFKIEQFGYQLPISLSYSYIGHKPSVIPSSLGLGFSLNSGGAITRVVKGLADERNGFFYNRGQIDLYEFQRDLYLNDVLNRRVDNEPDIFYFSCGEYSGSFYFKNGNEVILNTFNNIKVIPNVYGADILGFTILTPDGTKYEFLDNEYSSYKEPDVLTNIYIKSSWLISKILPNNGSSINFEYYDNNLSFTNGHYLINHYSGYEGGVLRGQQLQSLDESYASSTTHFEKYLKSISFETGKIVFEMTNRLDRGGQNAKKIESVRLFNKSGIFVNGYRFNYFENNTERLKLRSIIQEGEGEEVLFRQFSYNPLKLPWNLQKPNYPYDSNQIDHWGFYNGEAGNDTKSPVPLSELDGNLYGESIRTPNPQFASAEILTEIKYPTGGTTKFDYELHDFSNQSQSYSTYFKEKLEYHSYELDYDGGQFTVDPYQISFSLQSLTQVQVFRSIKGGGPNTKWIVSNNSAEVQNITLSPGTYNLGEILNANYLLHYDNSDVLMAYGAVSFKTIEKQVIGEHVNGIGGGIRISKITGFNSGGEKISEKKYLYRKALNSTVSSGFLTLMPTYVIRAQDLIPNVLGIYYSSNPILGYSESEVVGYSSVYEVEMDGSYKKYTYTTIEDNPDELAEFEIIAANPILAPRISNKVLRGRLLTEEIYNSVHTLLQQDQFIYGNNSDTRDKEIKYIMVNPTFPLLRLPANGPQYYDRISAAMNAFYIKKFPFIFLQEHRITSFYDSKESQVINSFKYHNPEHSFVTASVKANSNGDKSQMIWSYPLDYSNSFISLINKNFVKFPIEKVTLNTRENSSSVVNAELTKFTETGLLKEVLSVESENPLIDFKFSNKPMGIIPPSGGNGSFEPDGRYKRQFIVLDYDNYSNPREVKKRNLPTTVYLWGYGGQYPVAKIDNATYSEVVAAITQPVIDNLNVLSHTEAAMGVLVNNLGNTLRSAPGLSRSAITTYTYKTLVGMTSMTDPRGIKTEYKYDGFQRLKDVLDFDGNILKNYKYHYRP